MSQRLYYGKNTPISFEEHLIFTENSPYSIRYKKFESEDIAPLHYGTAMEIGLFHDISGHIYVNQESLSVNGNVLAVFPPNVVHSLTIHPNNGDAYILHVSLTKLKKYIDIEELFHAEKKNILHLVGIFPCYHQVKAGIEDMIAHDDDLISRNRALLEIFECLALQLEEDENIHVPDPAMNTAFMQVINWTQEHYNEKISLSMIAERFGFSENYFCYWFKKNGGVTYKQYLNSVRLNQACSLLSQGKAVSDACYASGFTDLSYFSQLFKKTFHSTPKDYRRRKS